MTKSSDLLYQIALTQIEGVGDINAKKLIAYCGCAEAIFKEKKSHLLKIPGIGEYLAKSISKFPDFVRAEKELKFIEKNNIQALFYSDSAYPSRLKHCEDSPILIYYKGNADLNAQKVVSIVGSRMATEYGKEFCDNLVAELTVHKLLIVSGLAYGIDICAHKSAIKYNLPTVGVLAHGLDKLYPSQHQNIADKMLENGGLISDFMSETIPDKQNFPKRNRIVAGISDATIVIEASIKGGALITANIANSYSRDVFAVPGKINDTYSIGCNKLIKTNKAALLESVKDLEYIMGWELQPGKKKKQTQLFVELNAEEKKITEILEQRGKLDIDTISIETKLPTGKLAGILLNLEFSGVLNSLPGKVYELI